MRRQKTIILSSTVLEGWLEDIVPELPENFAVIGARWHTFTGAIEFLVHSEEFPEILEGSEPEMIE